MSRKKNIVTLDGPSGVGKSTISRKVASLLQYTYLDTGAMYRAVGFAVHRAQLDCNATEIIEQFLDTVEIELVPAQREDDDVGVLLNGEDVSKVIRSPDVSMLASKISAIPVVRRKLTFLQQKIGVKGRIVAEGRDTGTVVFPDAAFKFYLDADPHERARRRVGQLRQQGMQAEAEEILTLILQRDKNDSERSIAPLKKADDAYVIDTSRLTIDEVISAIMDEIRQKQVSF